MKRLSLGQILERMIQLGMGRGDNPVAISLLIQTIRNLSEDERIDSQSRSVLDRIILAFYEKE